MAVTALRALLKWFYLAGTNDEPLSEGVGPISYSAVGALSKAIPPSPLRDLAEPAAVSASPCRDRPLMLVLFRLGLRSRETADLFKRTTS